MRNEIRGSKGVKEGYLELRDRDSEILKCN